MRDPHFQKILAGLEGPLDGEAFEACVVDLLREAYPSLASVRGGSDAGMDGAIADGEGEPYPLIATTQVDVRRNLRKNLKAHIASGKERRQAVLATSRRVTPEERRKLESIARAEFGVTLSNVYERYDVASRLYRDSRWARDLLGITGEPPALSAVPLAHRPLPELELVGRDADLLWLRETKGDRLVVGQPGAGKTALLRQLVADESALFLASYDESRIADACRDLEPRLLLVDDAHLLPAQLERLLGIRAQIGARFDVVASTWPGFEEEVAEALGGIASDGVRTLELLTRAEIVRVLRSLGVEEEDDDPRLRLLVDQASNKPGLAVTLGCLWLRGEDEDLLSGKALRRTLVPALKRLLEHDPTCLLACFGLGGEYGMSSDVVAEFLGLGLGQAHEQATRASQAGILRVNRDRSLAVEPEALRSALLAEVFFPPSPRPSLPYRPLFDRAPCRPAAIETLAMVALRGVDVPRHELLELLLEGGSRRAWQAFAASGESEGNWVLEHFPGRITEVASQLLERAPQPTMQRLLREAEVEEVSSPGAGSSLPLRVLRSWVQGFPDPKRYSDQLGEVLERREQLVKEARSYMESGGDRVVGLQACFFALSPGVESNRWTATREALTSRHGLLPATSIPRMEELWAEVREGLGELPPESWAELQQVLQSWLRASRGPLEKTTDSYGRMARKIVSDLGDRARDRPGLLSALLEWSHRLNIPVDCRLDEDFAVLFPRTDEIGPETWREVETRQHRAAGELAERWVLRPAREVAHELARHAAEARGFVPLESQASRALFHTLAGEVESPGEWFEAFFAEQLPAGWLEPVLGRVVREGHEAWEQSLRRCLDREDYAWLAAELAIRSESVSGDLLQAALAQLPAACIEAACSRGLVPAHTRRLMLEDERQEVAAAAIVGEWLCAPQGEIRSLIRAEWRSALLRLGSTADVELLPTATGFWLKRILGSDPDLATSWLRARVEGAVSNRLVARDGIYAAAIQALPSDQREELARQLSPDGFSDGLGPLLVGAPTKRAKRG